MRKLAVFVEGQTEQVFVERLLTEIAGRRSIRIETSQGSGGRKVQRIFLSQKSTPPHPTHRYYAMIYDCANDGCVVSDLRDNYANLVTSGYTAIVGIRDVFPRPHDDIPQLEDAFKQVVPTQPVTPLLALGVMEVEAWFLAEHSHFARIHPQITPARGVRGIGVRSHQG